MPRRAKGSDVSIKVDLPVATRNAFHAACKRRGVSMNRIMQAFVDEWIELNPPEPIPDDIERCGNGHPLTEENRLDLARGSFNCRVCNAASTAAYRQRQIQK